VGDRARTGGLHRHRLPGPRGARDPLCRAHPLGHGPDRHALAGHRNPRHQRTGQQRASHIRNGIDAYDALQTIRSARSDAEIPAEARFEENGANLGYALLLKRYVDDPRQATAEQIHQAAMDTIPPVGPLFWTFRIMVALGMFFIVLTGTFFWLSCATGWMPTPGCSRLPSCIQLRGLRPNAAGSWPSWSRQPWIIEGVLPTAMAVSTWAPARCC
jgi:cytochrome bd-type quinol oxidase subunit 1